MTSRTPATPRRNPIAEFAGGFLTLIRGFTLWRRTPRLMALGLLPAFIVGAVIVAAVVVLGVFFDPITGALTFFADGWERVWRDLARLVVAIALIIATLALAARTFTAITLLVGAPFYDRIQQAADDAHGGIGHEDPPGFGRIVRDTALLIVQSLAASIVVVLLGLIPVIGSVLSPVVGFVVTAWALSRELTLAPYSRRGLDWGTRKRVRAASRPRTFGFGVAVQLCYLVPLGAVLVMPAAVVGATLLVRDTLGESTRATV